MSLNNQILKSFRIFRTFYQQNVTSLDFSPNGNYLVSVRGDQLVFHNCEKGTEERMIISRKHGVYLVHFFHSHDHIIHTSTKLQSTIHYLNVESYKYLGNFQGHTEKATSLCVSPVAKNFLSTSVDKTVRLWDVRARNCIGVIKESGNPIAAYNPTGVVFAVGVDSKIINLYDTRSFDNGPFQTFELIKEMRCDWTELKFSLDSNNILINTSSSETHLINAINGKPINSFSYSNVKRIPIEASFSPDSQYIITGSGNGRLHAWCVKTGQQICVLNCARQVEECVKFNPKLPMLASAGTNMAFWLPTLLEI